MKSKTSVLKILFVWKASFNVIVIIIIIIIIIATIIIIIIIIINIIFLSFREAKSNNWRHRNYC